MRASAVLRLGMRLLPNQLSNWQVRLELLLVRLRLRPLPKLWAEIRMHSPLRG